MPFRRGLVFAARILGVAILLVLVLARKAYAYTDPATGSLILQLLAAGFVTFMVIFRNSLHRITDFLRRGNKQK